MTRSEETLDFKKYAASCGASMLLDGKITTNAEVQLRRNFPYEVHYRQKTRRVSVGVYAVWNTTDGDRLFEGSVTESALDGFQTGSRVIGITGPEASLLVANVSEPIDKQHLVDTYNENQRRQRVLV